MNRRQILASMGGIGALSALAGCASSGSASAPTGSRKTFILAPGAYGGRWMFERVENRLLALGHRVYSVTFSGLGERAHTLTKEMDVNTHVADFVNLINIHDLNNVVLVSHSYAGIPATAAADQIGPGRIAKLIYVDALVPNRDMGWRDFHTEPQQKGNMDNIANRGDGIWIMPNNDVAATQTILNVTREDAQILVNKSTKMSALMYTSRVSIKNGGYTRFADRVYIECNTPILPTIMQSKTRIRSESGWKMVEIKSGHSPMMSQPDELTAILTA